MTSLKKLTFTKQTKIHLKIKDADISYNLYRIDSSIEELTQRLNALPNLVSIGIDPGKNFGLTIISKDTCAIMNGVLDDSKYALREVAFWMTKYWVDITHPEINIAVVEGASYGDRFGQVKLAEIRCGFLLGLSEKGVSTYTVAPKTPRKVVFGSGDLGAWDVWPTMNHNACDSLCLALYPFYAKEVPSEETKRT